MKTLERSFRTVRNHPLATSVVSLILVTGISSTSVAGTTRDEVAGPNILWITLEDMSCDLGCYGETYATTPNIDRLASEGMRYTQAFGHAGVCAVNRSGIITCMYPTTIGTHHMRCAGVPPAEVRCFTEYLRAAGYYCTNNRKTDYNFAAPRTAWDENGRDASWQGRETGQPFFSVINLTITHESQIRLPADAFEKRVARLSAAERHDPREAILPPYYPDTPVVRQDWANYFDLITAADHQVGEILEQLEREGLAENTVVFLYSDHGRGLPRAKRWLYDSGLRVPLIVRWPGTLAAGTTSDELVAFIDLGATVLSIAGIATPDHFQGQPFLGDFRQPPREYIYAARDRMDEAYDVIRAVRDQQFKYLRNYEPQKTRAQWIDYLEQMPTMRELRRLHAAGELDAAASVYFEKTKPAEELYDLQSDPHEIRNLAADPAYSDMLRRLRAAHKAWVVETGDLGLQPETEIWNASRPGDEFEQTAAPTVRAESGPDGHVQISLHCETEGASIAYTTESGKAARWKLYTEPITLRDSETLRAIGCRLGFRDSEVEQFAASQ